MGYISVFTKNNGLYICFLMLQKVDYYTLTTKNIKKTHIKQWDELNCTKLSAQKQDIW